MLYKMILTVETAGEILSVATQIKATELYFHMAQSKNHWHDLSSEKN